VINNPIHPISLHGHFRNSLNNYRRWRNYRNRCHLLHHVLPLEELATSNLKHMTDYTQSHTKPKQMQTCMYMKGCLPKSRDTCRTHGEGSLEWLLGSSSWGHGNSGNTFLVIWDLRPGSCLRWEREREKEWMATFVWRPATKCGRQKIVPKHSKYDHCYDPQLQRAGGDVTWPIATNDQSSI
jgi:hypothetical protein